MEQHRPGGSDLVSHRFTAQWQASSALALVRDLNFRCLDCLQRDARTDTSNEIEVVALFRERWRELDVSSLERLASLPLVMLNVQFQNESWWRQAHQRQSKQPAHQVNPLFPARHAATLMRETLTVAWHTARMDRYAATVLVGLAPGVATLLSEFGIHDVEDIAARHSSAIRLRWESTPWFWKNLLAAARSSDKDALRDAHLHALQLLGGELLVDSLPPRALAPRHSR